MRTFNERVAIVRAMIQKQGPTLRHMQRVLTAYDGDWVVPLPKQSDMPTLPPLTPALVGSAVDEIALRASSVRPTIFCPAIDPRKDTGVRSREYAQVRRRMLSAVMSHSKWQLGSRRVFRHFAAYHTSSMAVVPDLKNKMPRFEVRNPLATFVEDQAAEELRSPEYVCYLYEYSGSHMRNRWPELRSEAGGMISPHLQNELWQVAEWHDCEGSQWMLMGPVTRFGAHVNESYNIWQEGPCAPLSREFDNQLDGRIPAVVPQNVSLGRLASRIGSMLGNVELQARLMALDIIAQEKAISPDMYVLGRMSGQPSIVGGQWKDGRTGEMNLVMDAEAIGVLRTTPDGRTTQTIDRLERNFKTSNNLTAQMWGENNGSLRTGRAIDSMAGMAVDPMIQELHEVYEAWLSDLNATALTMWRNYWPNRQWSGFSGWPGDRGQLVVVPAEHVEMIDNVVSYTIAGADAAQQTQILGSLLGTNAIALSTFREKHPVIDNPEAEAALVNEQQLEQALMSSVMQQIGQGTLPTMVAVMIHKEMAKGHDIFRAMETVDKEMRKQQATPVEETPEGMVAPPEAMPGLQGGPEALQQPVPEPPAQVRVPSDVARMRQLMATMGSG